MINGKRIAAVLFLLINLASFAPNIYRSFVKISKLENELSSLKETEKNLIEKIDNYNEETEALKDDYNKEKLVRNKLQMVKPGEIIYRVTK